MSIVKSYSFPNGENRGDMFYIQHNSKNFTIVDCFLKEGGNQDCRKDEILSELRKMSDGRIKRFISTHPDKDHISGMEFLDDCFKISNFYAVENNRPVDGANPSFIRYSNLKKKYNFEIYAKRERAYLNKDGMLKNGRKIGSAGIFFLWPFRHDVEFRKALENVNAGHDGTCVNNISPIFIYRIKNGLKFMWMGDMLSDMQEEFLSYYRKHGRIIPHVDVLFHPHHGRKTAQIPPKLLEVLNPKVIVIGNAPSKDLDYLDADITITQNTAGDIMFDNVGNIIHVFTQKNPIKMPSCLTKLTIHPRHEGFVYQGSICK
jgi:hypothetical protein